MLFLRSNLPGYVLATISPWLCLADRTNWLALHGCWVQIPLFHLKKGTSHSLLIPIVYCCWLLASYIPWKKKKKKKSSRAVESCCRCCCYSTPLPAVCLSFCLCVCLCLFACMHACWQLTLKRVASSSSSSRHGMFWEPLQHRAHARG